MIVISGRCAHELYRESLTKLMATGKDIHVRGFDTVELLDVATVIHEPWHHCHFVPGRRWNPWLALSEAVWILAARQDIACLEIYNARIREFSDDGHTLAGAYGWRMKRQIEPLIARLQADPNDRRAVLSIWRQDDLWADTKDPPCNDLVMFKLRENKLHMTVMNRSNDIHWGLYGVNIPTFGILLDYIAARLECQMGTQTHLSNSLHVYTDGPGMKANARITERMMMKNRYRPASMPVHERAFTEAIPLDTLHRACSLVLNRAPYDGGIKFLEFANDFLLCWPDRIKYVFDCRWAENYLDWVRAAQIWQEEK